MTPQEALHRIIAHQEIMHDEMVSLMRQIMQGEISPVLIAAIITGLRVKRETIEEIAAAAQVMRELATKVDVPNDTQYWNILTELINHGKRYASFIGSTRSGRNYYAFRIEL